ncbi:hypothetical protein Tco_0621887 [Tanacetum coccineum]
MAAPRPETHAYPRPEELAVSVGPLGPVSNLVRDTSSSSAPQKALPGSDSYSQEVLEFSVSGNPTPTSDLIVSTSSPTLTSFGDSDFLLEETDAFLAIEE